MTIQSKPVRPAASPGRAARAAPARTRRRSQPETAAVVPARSGAPPSQSPKVVSPSPRADGLSGGDRLFLVFFAAIMIMVIAVVLVGAVDQMWVLVPVTLVDLTVTFVVIATLVSLLGHDGEPAG